jgi:large conductance mechanosensitive channel
MYGKFIQAVLYFLVVAAVIFFAIIKPMNAIRDRVKKPEAPAAPAGPSETDLLKDILAELKQRP